MSVRAVVFDPKGRRTDWTDCDSLTRDMLKACLLFMYSLSRRQSNKSCSTDVITLALLRAKSCQADGTEGHICH